jgi:hypothetical protein
MSALTVGNADGSGFCSSACTHQFAIDVVAFDISIFEVQDLTRLDVLPFADKPP